MRAPQVSHQIPTFGGHMHYAVEMLLVCHVILQCHVIRGPRDFIDAKPSWQVTTLPSLVARGTAVVEMKRNIPHALP